MPQPFPFHLFYGFDDVVSTAPNVLNYFPISLHSLFIFFHLSKLLLLQLSSHFNFHSISFQQHFWTCAGPSVVALTHCSNVLLFRWYFHDLDSYYIYRRFALKIPYNPIFMRLSVPNKRSDDLKYSLQTMILLSILVYTKFKDRLEEKEKEMDEAYFFHHKSTIYWIWCHLEDANYTEWQENNDGVASLRKLIMLAVVIWPLWRIFEQNFFCHLIKMYETQGDCIWVLTTIFRNMMSCWKNVQTFLTYDDYYMRRSFMQKTHTHILCAYIRMELTSWLFEQKNTRFFCFAICSVFLIFPAKICWMNKKKSKSSFTKQMYLYYVYMNDICAVRTWTNCQGNNSLKCNEQCGMRWLSIWYDICIYGNVWMGAKCHMMMNGMARRASSGNSTLSVEKTQRHTSHRD